MVTLQMSFLLIMPLLALGTGIPEVYFTPIDPPKPCPAPPPCSCSGNRLDCSNSNLTSMPDIQKVNYTWTYGWTVDLSYNRIPSIPAGAFRNIQVNGIQIGHNNISTIDDDAFDGQEGMIGMAFMQFNDMKEIPAVIGRMPNLTMLSIHDNPMMSYNNDILLNLTNLQFLDMGSRELTVWPSGLKYITSLYSLDIYQLGMDTLPDDAFEGFQDMQFSLWFQGTQFLKIPRALRSLRNLTDLMISDNILLTSESFDDDTFQGMDSLTSLYIDNSSLTEVPDITKLPNLQSLTITSTKQPITQWEARTLNFPSKLTGVTLDGARFKHIPPFVSKLQSLRTLSFRDSPIREIKPNDVAGLYNLTGVSLSGTEIRHIALDAFRGIHNLTYIDLTGAQIRSFPKAFQTVNTMRVINLMNNTIECTCADMNWLNTWKAVNYTMVEGVCANSKKYIEEYIREDVPKC